MLYYTFVHQKSVKDIKLIRNNSEYFNIPFFPLIKEMCKKKKILFPQKY